MHTCVIAHGNIPTFDRCYACKNNALVRLCFLEQTLESFPHQTGRGLEIWPKIALIHACQLVSIRGVWQMSQPTAY